MCWAQMSTGWLRPVITSLGFAILEPMAAPAILESPDWEEPLRLQSDTGFSPGLGV